MEGGTVACSALNPRTRHSYYFYPHADEQSKAPRDGPTAPGFQKGLRFGPLLPPPPPPCALPCTTPALSHSFPASYFSLMSWLFDNRSGPFMN